MIISDGASATLARRSRTRSCACWVTAALSLTFTPIALAQPDDDSGETATSPDSAEDVTDSAAETSDDAQSDEATSDGDTSGSDAAEGDTSDSDTSDSDGEDGGSGVEVTMDSGESLFESAVAGEGDYAESDGGSISQAYSLNGYARSDVYVGKVPGYDRSEIQAAYGELALKLDIHQQDYGSGFAELRLRSGLESGERDLIVDLREAYVNGYFGDLEVRLGKQIVVWGRADAFNPTNNITPVDLTIRSPVEDDRRVGNVGLRAYYNLLPVRLEGVWMPLYVPVEIPDVALPQYVRFTDPNYPAADMADGIFAGRVHFLFSAFEASVSYLHGYAPMPGLALQSYVVGNGALETPADMGEAITALQSYVVGNEAEARIARTAYNHDVIGMDFSTTVGSFGLRAEAAYRKPLHYQERVYAPRPDVQFVGGVDRQFGNLSVIAQYAGRYVLDWQKDEPGTLGSDALDNFQPPVTPALDARVREGAALELASRNQTLFQQSAELQHMVSLRLEYMAMHDTLSLSALGLMNVTTQEWLAYPKISYKFSDSMSGAIGGEIYFGPEGTLLDLIEDELSAGYAELRFSF